MPSLHDVTIPANGKYVPINSGNKFVYMVVSKGYPTEQGHEPITTSVVACSSEDAKRVVLNYLFMEDNYFYTNALEHMDVTVFCQAHDSQLGKVLLLTDWRSN